MQYGTRYSIIAASVIFALCSVLVWRCNNASSKNNDKASAKLSEQSSDALKIASVQARSKAIELAMQQNGILAYNTNDATLQQIQKQFLAAPQLSQFTSDSNGNKCLCEVFTLHQALASDIAHLGIKSPAYKIELYNYVRNATLSVLVDANGTPLQSSILKESAPDVPEHLKRIAVDIAINSKQVQQELGDIPEIKDAQMAYTKTALNRSKCQRSQHLCVAPTFVKGDKALWSIVDLTDLKLVGTRWTYVGNPGEIQVSERSLQNDVISTCYCEKQNKIDQNGWQMNYMLTSSDGLKISDVTYKGKKILKSAKLVDWHVSYSNSEGFGYSDGIGCPQFSLSAVTAWDAPKITALKSTLGEGFAIEQVFKSDGWPGACNYNYVQRYEFYNDGKFRVSTASIGRGCGSDGTYRPVFRIAFEGKNTFSEYNGTEFANWSKEAYHLQKDLTAYSPEGYLFKVNGAVNYYVTPGRGQFADGGRGDFAYTYLTKFKPEEGESDLVTIGPCCNTDYKQGPEKFIEPQPEALNNDEIVMWYVPQMKNDNTKGKEYCWAEAKVINGKYTTISYPCFAGPLFVPYN